MSRDEKKDAHIKLPGRCFISVTSVTNHCTGFDRQVTMRMLAAASSMQRLADGFRAMQNCVLSEMRTNLTLLLASCVADAHAHRHAAG